MTEKFEVEFLPRKVKNVVSLEEDKMADLRTCSAGAGMFYRLFELIMEVSSTSLYGKE